MGWLQKENRENSISVLRDHLKVGFMERLRCSYIISLRGRWFYILLTKQTANQLCSQLHNQSAPY